MKKALVIGINNYDKLPLLCSVKDAHKIKNILKYNDDESNNFEVNLITDPPSIILKEKFKKEIEKLFFEENDVALLYISGQGNIRSNEGYIKLPFGNLQGKKFFLSELLQIVEKSKAKNNLILLDCYTENFSHTTSQVDNPFHVIKENTFVLAASTTIENTLDTECPGMFTSLLLDAFQEGVAGCNENITIASFYDYIKRSLNPWENNIVINTKISLFKTQFEKDIKLRKVRQ